MSSTLFIVRIWQQPDRRGRALFRASVRAVDDERERLFTRASALARYFETLHAPGRKPADSHQLKE